MLFYLGQLIIGLFFIITGIYNIYLFKVQIQRLEQSIIPFPNLALIIALLLQIGGGLSLAFNYYPAYGAMANILFTLLATIFFYALLGRES